MSDPEGRVTAGIIPGRPPVWWRGTSGGIWGSRRGHSRLSRAFALRRPTSTRVSCSHGETLHAEACATWGALISSLEGLRRGDFDLVGDRLGNGYSLHFAGGDFPLHASHGQGTASHLALRLSADLAKDEGIDQAPFAFFAD